MSPGRARRPIVVKFGGASLRSPTDVARRVRAHQQLGEELVLVASARAGVTDGLERILLAPRARRLHAKILHRIEGLHPGLSAEDRLPLAQLRALVLELEGRGGFDPARADRHPSMGERLAVRWLAGCLRRSGVPAVAVDADALGLVTDRAYGGATIDLDRSRRKVRTGLRQILRRGTVPVVTGFFGRGDDGQVAVLGRGGSDYSATAIARLIGARRVDLVKPGRAVRSADPRRVDASRPVPDLSYETAEELAHFGARVLHPLSIEPARGGRIPIRVLGSRSGGSATSIGPGRSDREVRIVTASAPLRRIIVPVVGGRHRPGALAEVSQRLADAGVPILGVFTGASHLALLVPRASGVLAGSTLLRPGSGRLGVPVQPGVVVVVSVVGAGLLQDLGRIPKPLLASALEVAAAPRSIAVVVPIRQGDAVVRALHRALVEHPPAPAGPRAHGAM
ncbi:MAG: aspartate kinase [Thermoplasmata archaeon]|nr:aspartate kinase [Thermoplasmata archaeon]